MRTLADLAEFSRPISQALCRPDPKGSYRAVLIKPEIRSRYQKIPDVETRPVPTPFSVGQVNCYILTSDAVTVIDPGPTTDQAYDALEAGLSIRGLAVADIRLVLITTRTWTTSASPAGSGRTPVPTWSAHRDAVDRMAGPDAFLAREQTFFRPYLRRMDPR